MSSKKLFSERRTFNPKEDIETNSFNSAGRPSPREVKSQIAQLESNQPGTRKDVKINMDEKLN